MRRVNLAFNSMSFEKSLLFLERFTQYILNGTEEETAEVDAFEMQKRQALTLEAQWVERVRLNWRICVKGRIQDEYKDRKSFCGISLNFVEQNWFYIVCIAQDMRLWRCMLTSKKEPINRKE